MKIKQAVYKFHFMVTPTNPEVLYLQVSFVGLESGEMMSLEDEISHLQKENSRIESQLSRMKGDVSSAETEAVSEDKVRILNIPSEILKLKYCRIKMN